MRVREADDSVKPGAQAPRIVGRKYLSARGAGDRYRTATGGERDQDSICEDRSIRSWPISIRRVCTLRPYPARYRPRFCISDKVEVVSKTASATIQRS